MSSSEAFTRTFKLPSSVTLPKTAASVRLAAETSGDVLESIARDDPFPAREIRMGSIALETGTKKDVVLGVQEGQVSFGASFTGSTGIAVVDSPQAVVDELGLTQDTPVPLAEALAQGDLSNPRYLVFRAGYRAEGEIEGSHPIGAVGTIGFGAAGEAAHLFAVVHRIDPATGAASALKETIGSLRLPRQVRNIKDLRPGSALIVEANASVAFNLSAQLGYDFSFVRDLGALGLEGDIGLRVETGLKATLGVSASGRYLVAIDRPSSDDRETRLHVRLFKLRQKGWDFGLNMAVGVTATAELPDEADDFVKAVFGVHGQQVVRELRRIEEWTDPGQDLSKLVAGLATEQGLELLEKTTGIDPAASFDEARESLSRALDFWDALPADAATATWKLLDEIQGTRTEKKRVLDALALLSARDADQRRDALLSLTAGTDFESTPVGRFVHTLADQGALALVDRVDLPDVLDSVIDIVSGRALGDVVRRLHDYVEGALDIDKLRTVAAADFDDVHSWLVGRLSSFLAKPLDSGDIEEVRETIYRVVTLRHELYRRAKEALNRRYDFTLAATWQKTTTRQLLLDAEFDMSSKTARDLFGALVSEADYDRVLTTPDPAVRLRSAVMSHEIERASSIAVHMPFLDRKTTTINRALASLRVEDDGERVLVYSLDAKDEVTTVNRMRSSLAVTALVAAPLPGVRIHRSPSSTWSYSYRMARRDMRSGEVAETLRPLVDEYFPTHFPDGPDTSLEKWVADLDRAIEDRTGNGTTEFGDVLLSLDVRLGGNALAPWLAPRTREETLSAAKLVSIRLQRQLKKLIPTYYFQDPDKLWDNTPASALLVWSAIPPIAGLRLKGGKVVVDPESDDVYWNWPDPETRKGVAVDPRTVAGLAAALSHWGGCLRRAGREDQARRFDPARIQTFVTASGVSGGAQFESLLASEAVLVEEARKALVDIAEFWEDSVTAPSRAIHRLAEFGAKITRTFNSRLASVYGKAFLRPMGSAIFLEAAEALDPALQATGPDALLVLKILAEGSAFDLDSFLENQAPASAEVVLEQRLVSRGS